MSIKQSRRSGALLKSAGVKRRRAASGKVTLPKSASTKRHEREGSAAAGASTEFAVVLEGVLATVPDAARDGFVRSVSDEAPDELDTALWGAGPELAERREAALANLRNQYEARRKVLDASLTRTDAAELLDVSEQAILDRLKAGDLIGLRKGREWRLPAWQFSPDTERGLLPGLARLRDAFPGGAVSMTTWATQPHADLEGASPAEQLAAGEIESVLRAARVGATAAW